jgi:peptidoglycan/xylan/chitin deacetylase (PgdA/CDA1 family)
MRVLKKFRPVHLSEFQAAAHPRSVAVTFDDGYADNLHCAAAVLEQHAIPATFFLTSGYLGGEGEFWWDELQRRLASHAENNSALELTIDHQNYSWNLIASPDWKKAWLPAYLAVYDLVQPLADAERRRILLRIGGGRFDRARDSHRVLSMDEVSRLSRPGLLNIGAHTVTHPRLAAHPPEAQLNEMEQSRRFLEAAVGYRIETFSYPYGGPGHYSPASVEMARRAGFSIACTTSSRPVTGASHRLELPRVVVENINGDQFEQLLNSQLRNQN